MGRPVTDPTDLEAQLQDLRSRIERLERRTGLRRFTNAERPPAATMKYQLIANETTNKVEWSDGANWQALY